MSDAAALRMEPQSAWAQTADAPQPEPAQHDFELARRIADGDAQAFEALYARHHRRVYSLCLRMTQHVAEAEDLTQEVFVQVYRKACSFRGASTFTTWLHRLTVNQVLMHFRRMGVRKEQTTDDGLLPEQPQAWAQPVSAAPAVGAIALERAVAQLPPGYRAVFILHDVEGYEHEEIAKLLGCSTGTSKSQLHKARMKLRKLLRQDFRPHAGQPRESGAHLG
ncbi:MAG TPA: RNA polymerase sigma factor [Pyrinomonadaceae bacterium]|jgi:RNA polymerase sigma-70 factor (ECF subfamily)